MNQEDSFGSVKMAKRGGYPLFITILFIISLALQLFYLYSTDYLTRTYDVEGHIEHVKIIATQHQIPSSERCWQCYHPPLYYLLSAGLVELFNWKKNSKSLGRKLQIFSLFLFVLFQIVGVLIINFLLQEFWPRGIASVLFLFWPSGLINSVRVGNDDLFYLLQASSLFLLLLWMRKRRAFYLYESAIVAGLSILTKFNGAITLAMLGGVAILNVWKREEAIREGLKHALSVFIIGSLFLLILLGIQTSKGGVYSNAAKLNPALSVEKSVVNLFTLDLKTYYRASFISPWIEKTGRKYFLNYLLKSSLFGEFWYKDRTSRTLARWASIVLLPLVGISLYGACLALFRFDRMPLLLLGIFSILALLLYHSRFWYGCTQDFRYIYPVVLSISIFIADGSEALRQYRWGSGARCCISILVGAFILSGIGAIIWPLF